MTDDPTVIVSIDGHERPVPAGSTILDACRAAGVDIPTLCLGPTITPRNACRVCMVELEGSRALVPSCSRPVEDGMVVRTATDRTDLARRMVLELLGSAVDLSLADDVDRWNTRYGADPARFGAEVRTTEQPVRDDNDLYVRDLSRCIMCYQCVDACGEQWQNTFAITAAGRGFDIRIATEFDGDLPDSACVYCGNCIQVCPTGALMFLSEHEMRRSGTWNEDAQTQTDTVCGFCGVGCNLTLHVQDDEIVKVTSPADSPITHGNLCVKGRFGFQHVQNLPGER